MFRTLAKTKDLDHEIWLKYRKLGIGGSDAGAICGLNPYVSPISVYLDKTSDKIIVKDNEAMRQGRDLEQYVADRFTEETGKRVRRDNRILQNVENPFMFANVDRMIVGESAGLECKTASPYSSSHWEDGHIPEHYQIQCHHYMAVTGAKEWYIAVVILGREFKFAKIKRDEEVISSLISIEKDFWENNILKRKMPSPDGSTIADEVINSYYKSSMNKSIELQQYEEQLKRRDEIINLIAKMDKEKKEIEQKVKIAMEDAEMAITSAHRISWKSYSTARIDLDRLKKEQPDIYTSYRKQSNSRRFIVEAA